MNWKEININTTYQAYPAINNLLQELEVKGITKEELESDEDEILIKAYLKKDINLEKLKEKISSLEEYGLRVGSAKLKIKSVIKEDWASKWKENFKPLRVSDRIIIKPSWEEYPSQKDNVIIEIDPGQAFGTGHHETTEVCLRLIEDNLDSDTKLLDIGTGTGILSIAAAKLGAEEIFALDIDPIAVKVAKENATLNQVETEIDFVAGDLVEVVDKTYNLVVANLLPHIIVNLIPDLEQVITENGKFILSGIIVDKEEKINDKLREYDFKVIERIQLGEWVTIIGEQK
ncbi:ribosomal protein L11 methyltransferase [Halobacteroides halobius DSM 5150]|uniref:Ribosomal protein L11 methyltransferase n=1 Tax=Halobacteroides halobius (strain ATCC 35273 / DSM 5150 / MD-1) TaxID=748449 RepID=L0K964_HALHC|nr:50S ribosomal protein L11 methyltransferase [Halobacteroides halobius]AGB41807.1 ribosomal protein L11 methyltransferase [Halobacteroides halobius DSM 5150]